MKNRLLKLLNDNRQSPRRFEVKAEESGDEAEIFLYDTIVSDELEAEYWGGVAPESFVRALRGIKAGTIHLRINSPGGSVFAARAIEQALRDHKARVVVHVDGLAASAATFIAMAGDEVVMSKGAMFMIHRASTVAWGNAEDLMDTAGLLEKIDGTLAQTYADRTKQKLEQVAEWMAAETWFTAEEAVEHGFADRIADADVKASAWNLAAYGKAPPEPAPEPPTASTEHRARQTQRMRVMELVRVE